MSVQPTQGKLESSMVGTTISLVREVSNCQRTNGAAGGIVHSASDWPVGLLARCQNGRF